MADMWLYLGALPLMWGAWGGRWPGVERGGIVEAETVESLLDFAEAAALRARSLESQAVFGELECRYADLLSAMQWFIDEQRTDEALRLATALALFWASTTRLDDGVLWSERALASPGGSDAHRGRTLHDVGLLLFWQGDDARASVLHRQALAIGRRIGDPTVTALALAGLARVALRSNVAEARRLCHEALAVTEGAAASFGRSSALHVLAVAAQMAGDFLEARALMTARIALAREQGNFAVVSSEDGNLSMVERQLGNLEGAEALAREALAIDDQRGDGWAIPYKISALAAVATERREFAHAATLVGAAESLMEAQGAAWPPDERPHYERMVAILSAAMGATEYEHIRAVGHAMSPREAIDYALGERSLNVQ